MGINVLSCFDGISCGQLALRKLGVKVDCYYASEIDKYAIKITQHNFPNTIQVGDISKLKSEDFKDIKLLLGGSPCQGFSLAGKRLNFEDPRSKLFFEFVRLLKEIKPKYFLLENVKMKLECQDVISEHLGVQPIEINSSLLSAQNRKRLYWTNIPDVKQPGDKNVLISNILDSGVACYCEKYGKHINKIEVNKSLCLLARDYKSFGNQQMTGVLEVGRQYCRMLSPVEYERLQTLPDNYSGIVSKTQRYKALGNAWTVDVIAHILSYVDMGGLI